MTRRRAGIQDVLYTILTSLCSLSLGSFFASRNYLSFSLDPAGLRRPSSMTLKLQSPVDVFLDLHITFVGSSSPLASAKLINTFDSRRCLKRSFHDNVLYLYIESVRI